jgi:hypothetical protein
MKRTFSIAFALALALSLGLVIAAQTPVPALAASIYESYNAGDDGDSSIYGSTWRAQTFTPSVAHTITSVKLMLWRTGSGPGTITVGIRATDGSGLPTGSDLCSGTIDGNTLTISSAGAWYEITFASGYDLSAGTQYAIVARAPGGDAGNRGYWRRDASSATYSGGNLLQSANSGSTWTPLADRDFMFEEWGDPLGGAGTVGWETYPVGRVRVLLPWIALFGTIVAAASLLVLSRRRAQS